MPRRRTGGAAPLGRRPSTRQPTRFRGPGALGTRGWRSRLDSRRALWRTRPYSPCRMGLRRPADRRARALGAGRGRAVRDPVQRPRLLGHRRVLRAMATDWFDGRIARRAGRTSPFGSLLDPVADKLLVLSTLIVLLGAHVFPAWMVAAIVARELLISGLRQAAVERGIVIAARDLGKLKTWAQAIAAARRRPGRGGRLARRRRLVGAAGRARPDLAVGDRLRPLGAETLPPARRRLRLTASTRATSRRRRSRAPLRARLATMDPADGSVREQARTGRATSGDCSGSSSSVHRRELIGRPRQLTRSRD